MNINKARTELGCNRDRAVRLLSEAGCCVPKTPRSTGLARPVPGRLDRPVRDSPPRRTRRDTSPAPAGDGRPAAWAGRCRDCRIRSRPAPPRAWARLAPNDGGPQPREESDP
ncbi:hypothetical protein NKH77_56155 [Streptomyces sp. M19]